MPAGNSEKGIVPGIKKRCMPQGKEMGYACASLAPCSTLAHGTGRQEGKKREDRWSQRGETEEVSQILKGKSSSGKAKAARKGERCCLAKL